MKAFTPFLVTSALFFPYLFFILFLFGIFLIGFEYHVFVILFSGQKGLVQTVKTVMYTWTPALLFGWIPYLSIIGSIWTLILIIIGIRENQEMTTGRALLVLVVLIVHSILFLAGLFAVIGSFFQALLAILPG